MGNNVGQHPASYATSNIPEFPPQPPYKGSAIEYHFVLICANLDIQRHISLGSLDASFLCTNIEQFFSSLTIMYQQGYRMLAFIGLPASVKNHGLAQLGRVSMDLKFQGIFRKLFPDEMNQRWELRTTKSYITTQMFHNWQGVFNLSNSQPTTGNVTNSSHIFQTISDLTRNGGRLVSVELAGIAEQQMETMRDYQQRHDGRPLLTLGHIPSIQVPVDIFYEIPLHPNVEIYNYEIVETPMISNFRQAFPNGIYVSNIDWQGIMSRYLGCGWKLVEIFDDKSSSTYVGQNLFSPMMTKSCLWIFEKPMSRMNDSTAYYECTMMDYWYETRTSGGFSGVSSDVIGSWDPLLNHMATAGWQVVRILDTPDVEFVGSVGFSNTTRTRQMIIFQRRIAGMCDERAGGSFDADPLPDAAPPSYDAVVN